MLGHSKGETSQCFPYLSGRIPELDTPQHHLWLVTLYLHLIGWWKWILDSDWSTHLVIFTSNTDNDLHSSSWPPGSGPLWTHAGSSVRQQVIQSGLWLVNTINTGFWLVSDSPPPPGVDTLHSLTQQQFSPPRRVWSREWGEGVWCAPEHCEMI